MVPWVRSDHRDIGGSGNPVQPEGSKGGNPKNLDISLGGAGQRQ